MDINAVTRLVTDHMIRADANRRGHVVVELAILTMMIDAELVTTEEAAQRIEKIQSVLSAEYQAGDVAQRVKLITAWLRAHTKQTRDQWHPTVIEGGLGHEKDSDPEKPKI